MLKNLLLFIVLFASILFNFNNLLAETKSLIPPKKPILSSDEFDKKISKNILRPLKKPSKIKKIIVKTKKLIPGLNTISAPVPSPVCNAVTRSEP